MNWSMLVIVAATLIACASDEREPAGERGAKGTTGDQGEPGEPGVDGDDGQAGPPGERGEMGEMGAPGARGASVAIAPEPEGTNCEYGGVALTAGVTTQYVCNGAPGPQGQPGPAGEQGIQGEPGMQGEQGIEGDEGPSGPPTWLNVVDANGVELGRYVTHLEPKYILVRRDDGLLISYHTETGDPWGYPLAGRRRLHFETTDCTGPAYVIWEGQIVDGAVVNGTSVYAVRGSRATRLMQADNTEEGVCEPPDPRTRDTVPLDLMGPRPTAAAVPLSLVEPS